MTDERIASGKFMSLDRLGSIMLEDVVEQRWLAYHDVSTADNKDTKSYDDNTEDASVTNSNMYITPKMRLDYASGPQRDH